MIEVKVIFAVSCKVTFQIEKRGTAQLAKQPFWKYI